MPRVGARAHDARGRDDVVDRDVAVVTDVLHLLAVAGRLLQRLREETDITRMYIYLLHSVFFIRDTVKF